ncbi:hypothetical protein FRB99_005270 [Tulasnella sp. 403]|nr:hypothetical protein FRB99_005270 [Tulasnella sp. 403]
MPKRPETPDIETEAKLVTVWNPWPGALRFYDNEVNKDKKGGIQRGLLRPEDATEIARWLSCIVGTDNVFAIYYKPQSHTTVIVEINEYDRFKHKLLGAHRWDDTFKILTRWCDLTDEISELCLPNPTDIFPETAVRHRPMTQEQVQIASAMTTPGTSDWQEARESGLAIPNIRVKAKKLAPPAPPAPQPIQEPNSSGSSKKKIDYIDVGAMRAVLGPPICDNLPDPNAPSVKIDWANAMDEEDARDAGDSFDPIWDEPDPPEFGGKNAWAKPLGVNGTTGAGRQVRAGGKK